MVQESCSCLVIASDMLCRNSQMVGQGMPNVFIVSDRKEWQLDDWGLKLVKYSAVPVVVI